MHRTQRRIARILRHAPDADGAAAPDPARGSRDYLAIHG
jgi:hypothetical protein